MGRHLFGGEEPRLELGFGLGEDRIRKAGPEGFAARFSVRERRDGAEDLVLFEEEVRDFGWRRRTVRLDERGFERLRMCVAVEPLGGFEVPKRDVAFWDRIEIAPGDQQPQAVEETE